MSGSPKTLIGNQVKHLLILISFLLLSSFVTSCDKKEETLYRWETSSGIVWKRFGDKDTHRVYKGEWKNEKLNGLGVMTYPDGHKYVGEWKNGKKMVKEHSLGLMVGSMLENGRMGNIMVKEHRLGMMEESMKGNGRMERNMVKEHFITLMEVFM